MMFVFVFVLLTGFISSTSGNVEFISSEFIPDNNYKIIFNVTMEDYPENKTTGPPSQFRDFYQIIIYLDSESFEDYRYDAGQERFYNSDYYPKTTEAYLTNLNPGEYSADFYFSEYNWGDYDYLEYFVETIEFTIEESSNETEIEPPITNNTENETEKEDDESESEEYESEIEIENATGKYKYKEKVKVKSNNRIRYEYSVDVELPENCKQTGSVTKCDLGNGSRQIRIFAGKSGNIIIQSKGVNMSTRVELFQSEGELYALLNDNSTKQINYLPDEIKSRLREKIKYKISGEEFDIELDEEGEYKVGYEKEARLLGMFRVREKVESMISSETGEILRERNSWWGFLARDVEEEIGIEEVNESQ